MKAASGFTITRCRLRKANQTFKGSIFEKGHLCLLFKYSQTQMMSFYVVLFIYLSIISSIAN